MSLFSSHLLPSPLFHVSTYFYACPSASICISSDICPPLSSYFFLLFRAFRLYRALGLRFWQNTSGSSLLSPWFFSRLSVCLRNGIQQQNDTCATFPLLKVETVLRKKKQTNIWFIKMVSSDAKNLYISFLLLDSLLTAVSEHFTAAVLKLRLIIMCKIFNLSTGCMSATSRTYSLHKSVLQFQNICVCMKFKATNDFSTWVVMHLLRGLKDNFHKMLHSL